MPFLIVRTGSTLPALKRDSGDFHDWIAERLHTDRPVVHLDAQTSADLPDPNDCAGIILTGSHAMVSEQAAWSERLAEWVATAVRAGAPLLGICFGHQLLAHATGGQVGFRTEGRELGTVCVELTDEAEEDPLFRHMPNSFAAHMVHEQSVSTLPPGAVRLASSSLEPHQAFRIGSSAWGVQFHPEFPRAAISAYRTHIEGEVRDDDVETHEAAKLLAHFAAVAGGEKLGSQA